MNRHDDTRRRGVRKLYADKDLGLDLANTFYALDATTIDSLIGDMASTPGMHMIIVDLETTR